MMQATSHGIGCDRVGLRQWAGLIGVLGVLAILVVPGAVRGQTTINAGLSSSLVVKGDGTVWAWGNTTFDGEDGSGGSNATSPVWMLDIASATAVAGGGFYHALALADDKTVWAWGVNFEGELGDGTDEILPDGPVQVVDLTNVIAIDAGVTHSLALTGDGAMWAWGANRAGQLGDGSTESRNRPTAVQGLQGVTAIAAGTAHSLALKDDGTVWAWGDGGMGQLGDGNEQNQTVPAQVLGLSAVAAIAAGSAFSLAADTEGTVWAWGDNTLGQLGLPAGGAQSVPVQVSGVAGVTAVAGGLLHSLALKTDGTVWAWGDNHWGQLGDGTEESREIPARVLNLTGIVAISAGSAHNLALTSGGTVWAWGMNELGELGDGSTTNRPTPVEVMNGAMIPGSAAVASGIKWVSSYVAAAGSFATIMLWGPGLPTDAEVLLVDATGTETEAEVTAEPGGQLRALFDLTMTQPGEYQLVVRGAGGQEFIAPQPFIVEGEKRVELWVDVLARSAVRIERDQTVTIVYGNSGNADALGVVIWIGGIPKDATWRLGFTLEEPQLPGEGFVPFNEIDYDSIPKHIEREDDIAIPLLAPLVATGSTNTLTIVISIPTEQTFTLRAWLNEAAATSPISDAWLECLAAVAENFLTRVPPGFDCAYAATQLAEAEGKFRTASGVWSYIDYAVAWVDAGVQCSTEIFVGFPPAALMAGIVESVLDVALATYGSVSDCLDAFKDIHAAEAEVSALTSVDPNDKVGPAGAGEGHYVRPENPFTYAIFFENLETASAPAQEVVITDRLDADQVDLTSFHLGAINFADRVVTPPPGQTEYSTEVDLRPDNDLLVKIEADLDSATGVLTWRFTALDPETGELPEAALAGFLPPNVDPPEGEGSVMYTVMANNDVPSGTEIRNQASIVFDTNDPIETGEVLNTIDAGPPSSAVSPLDDTQRTSEFVVSWSGTDDEGGSGIRDYTIYVAQDDGAYLAWLTNTTETSATYEGQPGHTYEFYSQATDNVGRVEDPRESPDAQTTVRTSSGGSSSRGGGGLCGMGMLMAFACIMAGLGVSRLGRRARPATTRWRR